MPDNFDPNAAALDNLAEPMEGEEMEQDDQGSEDARFAEIEARLAACEEACGIAKTGEESEAMTPAPAMSEGDMTESGLTA